jgi:hypothetical protein
MQMYILLLPAVNFASSVVRLYAHPVAVLGLTFSIIADCRSRKISGRAGYMYDAEVHEDEENLFSCYLIPQ